MNKKLRNVLYAMARTLILRIGEIRCKGHGHATYMKMRVLGEIIKPWGLVVMEKEMLPYVNEEKFTPEERAKLVYHDLWEAKV